MKIKIGNYVFSNNAVPMMVILSKQDKENIKNMSEKCTKYAVFPENFGSQEQMYSWMNQGFGGRKG